jgi:hypothetical protein
MVILNELIVFCVGSGLCDELITRHEESYRVCVFLVCDLETSKRGGLSPFGAVTPQKKLFSLQVNNILDVGPAKRKVCLRKQENTTPYNVIFIPYHKGEQIFPEI